MCRYLECCSVLQLHTGTVHTVDGVEAPPVGSFYCTRFAYEATSGRTPLASCPSLKAGLPCRTCLPQVLLSAACSPRHLNCTCVYWLYGTTITNERGFQQKKLDDAVTTPEAYSSSSAQYSRGRRYDAGLLGKYQGSINRTHNGIILFLLRNSTRKIL